MAAQTNDPGESCYRYSALMEECRGYSPYTLYIELMGTGSNVSLSRREADIALRIEDNPSVLSPENIQIDAEQIGVLKYAVYCAESAEAEKLPWAGLKEQYARTTGTAIMTELSGSEGIRYRAYQFDTLNEIVASGAARSMLPCFMADRDSRLKPAGNIVLEQPLWMLSHRQDSEVQHLESARDWLKSLTEKITID